MNEVGKDTEEGGGTVTSVTTTKLQEEVTSNVVRFTLLMFRRLHSDERGRGGVNCRLARLGLFKRVGTRSAVGQAGRQARLEMRMR